MHYGLCRLNREGTPSAQPAHTHARPTLHSTLSPNLADPCILALSLVSGELRVPETGSTTQWEPQEVDPWSTRLAWSERPTNAAVTGKVVPPPRRGTRTARAVCFHFPLW